MRAYRRSAAVVALLASAVLTGGCSVTALLNPDFLPTVLGGGGVAELPGDAPSIVVTLENTTDRVVTFQLMYRDANGDVETFQTTLSAASSTAQALICPVEEMTLGDLSNLQMSGAFVRLGAGTQSDPFVAVEPFGYVLREGVNYDCGDGVTFSVRASGATASGYQTFAFIQRAGD